MLLVCRKKRALAIALTKLKTGATIQFESSYFCKNWVALPPYNLKKLI